VRKVFDDVLSEAEIAEVTQEALDLRDLYLKHGIVSLRYADDALHVALATISACALIVSWNFKHIVHFDKIPLYNAVNVMQGYKELAIFSPSEVIKYE
jgi:hypothetical protein